LQVKYRVNFPNTDRLIQILKASDGDYHLIIERLEISKRWNETDHPDSNQYLYSCQTIMIMEGLLDFTDEEKRNIETRNQRTCPTDYMYS
jgi:hypothetical protein